MSAADVLMACPFCGKSPKVDAVAFAGYPCFVVRCCLATTAKMPTLVQATARWNTRSASLAVPAVPVPPGFVLVPIEPTQAMCKAARLVPEATKPYPPHFHLIWDAMLAASHPRKDPS